MNRNTWVVAALGVLLVWATTRGMSASEKAAKANARADSVAAVLSVRGEQLQEALVAHEASAARVDALQRRGARVDTVLVRAREAVPPVPENTPPEDPQWRVRSLAQDTVIAVQDSVIANRDSTIMELKADNFVVSQNLLRAQAMMEDAARELDRQSNRPIEGGERRKILGLIPAPEVVFGYGAQMAPSGGLSTGAQVTLGWRIAL